MSDVPAPRWGTPRSGRVSRVDELEQVATAFGIELFGWQRHVAEVALEVDEAGRFVFRNVGVGVGRQNGKTALAALRVAMELQYPGRHVAFTAQDRNMAHEKWREHVALIEASTLDVAKVIYGSGREHIEMANGSTYSIFTPSGKGARGKTLDLVVIDEALTHTLALISAVEPTMATKPDGQLWLLSNAGDATSELLAHYRGLGHDLTANPDVDNPARLAWFEWAPTEDRFDIADPAVWHQAIPTLTEDAGVVEDAVAQAAASQPPEVFAREWLNVWPALSATAVINPEHWEACLTTLSLPPAGIMLGVDVDPDRASASIVAAGVTHGRTILEVVDHRDGVGWVHDRLVQLSMEHRAPIVIDGGTTAAGSLIAPLQQAGIVVHTAKLRDYVNACSMFFDAVEAQSVGHPGDPRLDDAVTAAGRRRLGDAWAWQRRSTVDLTPLVAASLALWAQVTVRAPTPAIH